MTELMRVIGSAHKYGQVPIKIVTAIKIAIIPPSIILNKPSICGLIEQIQMIILIVLKGLLSEDVLKMEQKLRAEQPALLVILWDILF